MIACQNKKKNKDIYDIDSLSKQNKQRYIKKIAPYRFDCFDSNMYVVWAPSKYDGLFGFYHFFLVASCYIHVGNTILVIYIEVISQSNLCIVYLSYFEVHD